MPYKTIEYEDDARTGITAGTYLASEATDKEDEGWRPVLMQWVPTNPAQPTKGKLVVLFHQD